MKIITTPMCEEIVKLAGISEYIVNKFPDEEEGDLAIALSESNVEMDCVPIKINTPSQIFESIKKVSKINEKELSDEDVLAFFNDYELSKKYLNFNFKRDVNVKVYSKFLRDIVEDAGFNIVQENYDYVIYPDYLKEDVKESENLVEIPSHNCISKNPFEKVEVRYAILESLI
jgi:segregation and condensation protein B